MPVSAAPAFTQFGTNPAPPRIGMCIFEVTDQFFAAAHRMLEDSAAVFVAGKVAGKYDDHGKWMDGWESRRNGVQATTTASSV